MRQHHLTVCCLGMPRTGRSSAPSDLRDAATKRLNRTADQRLWGRKGTLGMCPKLDAQLFTSFCYLTSEPVVDRFGESDTSIGMYGLLVDLLTRVWIFNRIGSRAKISRAPPRSYKAPLCYQALRRRNSPCKWRRRFHDRSKRHSTSVIVIT